MGRPLKIKQSTTIDIGFNAFSALTDPTIPTGMTTSQYLGVVGGGFPSGIATAAYPTVEATGYITQLGSETPVYIITQKGATKYLVAANNTVTGGSFTPGFTYIIKSLGTTVWSAVGAGVNAQIGDVFTATAAGSGNGTVSDAGVCSLANLAAGALTAGTMQITITTTAGAVRASKLTNKFVWDYATPANRYAANFFVSGGAANPLATVAITGTAGQFSCAADTLAVGQAITISGTFGGTGSITGYVNPTTYYIIATNGTTTFTLSASQGGAAIVTTAGTPTGLTYTMAGGTTAKSGAEIDTWTNGTGDLTLAEVTDYTA